MNKRACRGLRNTVDRGSQFMGGHQILTIRRRKRIVPEWCLNDGVVRTLLLKSFPKAATDSIQRERAGRWLRIIHLYFKSGRSYRETAEEMGISKGRVHTLIRSIRRAFKGQPIDGKARKRKHAPIQTSFGE